MALASDKMAQLNEPRLLLDLDISGDRDKSLNLDLSKEELKSLISEMEKANKVRHQTKKFYDLNICAMLTNNIDTVNLLIFCINLVVGSSMFGKYQCIFPHNTFKQF